MYVCFAFLCGGVSVCLPNVLPRFLLACYLFSNEWARVPLSSLQTYFIPFPVCSFVGWFGWLLPVVLSHRHTAKSFLLPLSLAKCTPFTRNAARPTLFAITALPPLWSYVRVELLTR